MVESRVIRTIMKGLFEGEVDIDQIADEQRFEQTGLLDSYNLIRLAVALEKEFKIKFTKDSLDCAFESIKTICDYINSLEES